MELVKWLISAIIGSALAIGGLALVIGAMVFSAALQIIGIFGLIAGGIAMLVKEKIDERSDRQ